MNLIITGNHMELSTAVKEYIQKKLGHILDRNERINGAHVTLSQESHEFIAELSLHLPGKDLHCESRSKDAYQAIDALAHKAQRQLSTYKSRHSAAALGSAKRQTAA